MDGLNHTQNRKSSSITADSSEVLNLNCFRKLLI